MKIKEEVFLSKSAEETISIGESFSKKLFGGSIVALYGELGSGKTHFVKGVAKGLGIKKQITSPTFVISQQFKGKDLTLIHFDLYRISNFSELEDLGWYDLINSKNIIIIEWPEKIEHELLNHSVIKIYLKYIDENSREIKIIYES